MTETKTNTEVWDELAQSAEERAGRAAETARAARSALRDLEGERPWLAVAATEGDEGARERLAELDREVADKQKELEVAELAQRESARAASEHRGLAEQDRALQEAAANRARYDELADRRASLEIAATTAILDLTDALDAIKELDVEQRVAAREAGVHDAANKFAWSVITNLWLSAHLRPYASDFGVHPEYRKPLNEIEWLPRKAPLPEETAELAATREREHRAQRIESERAFEALELTKAIDDRRRALLAQTSHESSPVAVQRDIERQIEADLAREFPGYVPRKQPGYEGPPAQPGRLPGERPFGG